MRCLVCEAFSIQHICPTCQAKLIVPHPQRRRLSCGLEVLSFFAYDEVEMLLKTKHTYVGHYFYTLLAKASMRPFGRDFGYTSPLDVVAIDDHTRRGYAHTAILAHALHTSHFRYLPHRLLAGNAITYAGKSLAYREAHPREFVYRSASKRDVLLVDDVVTTGSTLCEAKAAIQTKGQEVLLAVVLADAAR